VRRLSLILLAALLVLPTAAVAGLRAAGDGTLVVRNANAKSITVQGKGTIIGHFDHGWIRVTDYNPDDAIDPQVNGAKWSRPVNDTTWLYTGGDIRFRFFGGRYKVQFSGTGIDISAVGRGTATLVGAGTFDDGDFAVNGGKFTPLGLVTQTVNFNSAAP
jgi:hypothetical protein